MESYPCRHTVTINGIRHGMDGVQIYQLYTEYGLPVPEHFQNYSNGYPEPVGGWPTYDIKPAVVETRSDIGTVVAHLDPGDVKPINVNEYCLVRNLEPFLCQHHVSIFGDKERWMDGKDIYRLYLENRMPVPEHFQQYSSV